MANNSAPYLRRAAALAFFTTMTNSGGILSTWLVGTLSPAPQYTKASIILIIFQIGMLLCAAVNVAYLQAKNKEKQRTVSHSELGKDAEDGSLGDDTDDRSQPRLKENWMPLRYGSDFEYRVR
ncbi:hypothetical protein PHLCEN_2v8862 [Hermanssonia centrifuga]|uniref:Uncharacterized protein n=1 Tax=Hermanssonia centrifuga TaxID=98765 RepID=A0A2R6NT83_9APHY|nr:hypothetical protein PHLCEN_2v8862 [Hermanssonia centrifuga]